MWFTTALRKDKVNVMERAVFSTYEAAAYIGVSRPTFFRLCNTEGFPAIRVGRAIRVPKAALDRWLEEHAGEQVLVD